MTTFTRDFIENLGFECRNASYYKKDYLVKKLNYLFDNWAGSDSINWNEWVGEEDVLDRELDSIFAKKWMTEIENQLDTELLDADE